MERGVDGGIPLYGGDWNWVKQDFRGQMETRPGTPLNRGRIKNGTVDLSWG